jgi:hypothetical protein|tara:strand:- start:388 stop:591 length:204 start_codon:yes stop_codon:yes gene_type:complete
MEFNKMSKYIYIVAECEYANFFGSLLPNTIKLFNSYNEVKKYIGKNEPYQSEKYTIIKRKLKKDLLE